jgi:hypothetical protein
VAGGLIRVAYESAPGEVTEEFCTPTQAAALKLAESLYAGQDCAFALHDALLEAGQAELAEDFLKETWHPKGCWAMDMILGKT